VLYGSNLGKPVQQTAPTAEVAKSATALDYDIKCFAFGAAAEQLREPRLVKIGVIQNQIVLPTTAPFAAQAKARPHPSAVRTRLHVTSHQHMQAIRERVGDMINAAGAEGTNVICLQEAWCALTPLFRRMMRQWPSPSPDRSRRCVPQDDAVRLLHAGNALV
jgi:beta-ureidopropionase